MSRGTAAAEAAMEVGSEQQRGWLRGFVLALLVLNALDLALTLHWVGRGIAREGNVLLADLVHEQPAAFVAAKVGLVAGGLLLLWWRRDRPVAVVGIVVAFVGYYAVLLRHLTIVGEWIAFATGAPSP